MKKNEKITALYERLSRDDFGKDDDQQRESNSISNQKAMLEEFVARQGFTNIVHFTYDGISGTCFDRPGFLAMMKEVEAGNVEYLCIKDMSRMGRDYLKVGQIMEILRQRGVRFIAINDGMDSAREDDDFTPFRNIMNEYYARDTSRKIHSTFQSKGKSDSKRKASGAQKRYEDKIKGRKKAEIEAKKAAIRAEDIAKGVFVPVSSLPQREPMKGVQTA